MIDLSRRRGILAVCFFERRENHSIKVGMKRQIIGMRKIKSNPMGKTREERESCFPEAEREEYRPGGERA